MPSERATWSNVKRWRPVITSCPTIERMRPSMRDRNPRMTDLPAKDVTREKASTMSVKYSAGPNIRARLASLGPTSINPMTLRVPPTNEPTAAMPRALPAFPCLASWYPSKTVTTEAASPGSPIRTDVMVPPYCVP
ncbi:MAG: hypothetical protein A4E73_01331 [Syntrophaceae bacterium PtaU1.Bin231]|nr:MAG: hypothetical protein A4E73_01331 [Syntrophaceae bacterium PtaU1.Bin231]